MAFDYSELVAVVDELLAEFGRPITLLKLDRAAADAAQPWDGPAPWDDAAAPAGHKLDNVNGVFVGKGANFFSGGGSETTDNGSGGLITRGSAGFLCSGAIGQDLRQFDTVDDSGRMYKIQTVNVLRPGDTVLLYGIEIVG